MLYIGIYCILSINELQIPYSSKDLVGKPVEVRVLFRALPLNHQGVAAAPAAEVDGGSSLMNEAGDKMATNRGKALSSSEKLSPKKILAKRLADLRSR